MSSVVLLKVDDYDFTLLTEKISLLFELLGGLNNIIPANSSVLLKPNLLSARRPDECVNTNPVFIKAIIEVVKRRTSRIKIGDSPGGCVSYEDVLKKSGLKDVALDTGVEIVKFENSKLIEGIPIAEEVLSADYVISLPKFKTHCLTLITSGVKNCFGCVPGLFKAQTHKRFPKALEFSDILLRVYKNVKPILTIVDAVWSMEGEGPSAGSPRKTGLILGSSDAVSVDALLSHLIGLNPFSVPTTKLAALRGIGEADVGKINVLGEGGIDSCKIKNFKLPKTSYLEKIPKFIIKILAKFIRFSPKVIPKKCINCGICLKSCPATAIDSKRGKAVIRNRECILCLCCYELCPSNAIEIKKSVLVKITGAWNNDKTH